MKQISPLREEVEFWQSLRQKATDALELSSMEDESLRQDLEKEATFLENESTEKSFYAKSPGNRLRRRLLAIHSGVGAPIPRLG
jgi:hypothetical protein